MTARAAFIVILFASVSIFSTASEATPRCWSTDDRYPCGGGVDMMGQSFRGEPLVPRLRGPARDPGRIVAHPAGCPRSLFCGCGVAVRVYGSPVRKLWPSIAWSKFPRASLAAGTVAWRPGHVYYIESVNADGSATVYDPNSGYGKTRIRKASAAELRSLRIVRPPAAPGKRAESVKPSPPDPEPYKLASALPGEPMLEEQPIPEASVPSIVPELSPRDLEVEAARGYLREVAGAGGTMLRQGRDSVMARLKASIEEPNLIAAFKTALSRGEVREEGIAVSIGRLHPDYAVKLATAVRTARATGLPEARPFSCYRPPDYRVGGLPDKGDSCHAYGLVCDMTGIGTSRSSAKWAKIATGVGLYRPWKSSGEFNHWQLVPHRICGTAQMRKTITGAGPKDLAVMWAAGSKLAATKEVSRTRYAKRKKLRTRYAHAR